ncbi:hypothetical protein WJX73_003870 [Symbiochloris irregularis]|uniref:Uncharacterized protein n=1 Tax=Symbiochloris irregularis TaxID=706552 RepID=A0AAW1NQ28_9CHLO
MLTTAQSPSVFGTSVPKRSLPTSFRRNDRRLVCRAAQGEPKETSDQNSNDSYAQIEAPVRDGIPDGGKPVSDRNWGQETLNPELKSDQWNPEKKILGTKVGIVDSLRFAGAVPEVANSRLAMLGFVLAVAGEAITGRNVFQQVQHAPGLVASIFVLFIVATLVPTVRGVPRKSFSFFTADAELVNGRVAMVAFFTLVVMSFYQGSYLGALGSWFS